MKFTVVLPFLFLIANACLAKYSCDYESLQRNINANEIVEAYNCAIFLATSSSGEEASKFWKVAGDLAKIQLKKDTSDDWMAKSCQAYKKALLLYPSNKEEVNQELLSIVEMYYRTGAKAFSKENYPKAINHLEKYIYEMEAIDPMKVNPFAYFFSGRASYLTGDKEMAKERYETALTIGFDDPILYSDLAFIRMDDGDTSNSLQTLQTGMTIYPNNKQLALAHLDIIFMMKAPHTKLENVLERITSTFPNDEEVYLNAGHYWHTMMLEYKDSEDIYYTKAREKYLKVLDMNPNNFDANYQMGLLLYIRAVRIIQRQRYDVDVWLLNTILDEVHELFAEALPYVEKARDLAPDNQDTKRALQGLYYNLNRTTDYKKITDELK